jgi:hypothetical protein
MTPQRIKIVVIVLILGLAAFFFISETPSDGLFQNNLASTTDKYPYHHMVNTTLGRPEYLRVYTAVQHYPYATKNNKKKIRAWLEELIEGEWVSLSSKPILSLSLQKNLEAADAKIIKVMGNFFSFFSFVSACCGRSYRYLSYRFLLLFPLIPSSNPNFE